MSLLGLLPLSAMLSLCVCSLMDGVFKFQHLAGGRSDVSENHSPGRMKVNTRRLGGDKELRSVGL